MPEICNGLKGFWIALKRNQFDHFADHMGPPYIDAILKLIEEEEKEAIESSQAC